MINIGRDVDIQVPSGKGGGQLCWRWCSTPRLGARLRAIRSGAQQQTSDTAVLGMVRRLTAGRATLLRSARLGAAAGAKPSTQTRAARARKSCVATEQARCSASGASH